jgi:hypothetical protein
VSRSLLLAALLTAALPAQCTKLLGRDAAASSAEPAPTPAPVPVPVPTTAVTTPPVWHPPEPKGPPPEASAGSSSDTDLAKARAASDAGEWKKVRSLLEKKVRSGKASSDEAQLLLDACTILRDRSCVEAVKAKHPKLVAKPFGADVDPSAQH